MMQDMAKRVTLDAMLTFRLQRSEKANAGELCTPSETLGDFAREALNREIARRKRLNKKPSK